MLKVIALRCLSFLVPVMPPQIGYLVAGLVSGLGYRLLRRARRNVSANLQHVLGKDARPAEREAMVRSVFRTGALNYYDLFRVPHLDQDQLARIIRVRGWEHVDAALRDGKGAILTGPHLGNLDVVGQMVVIRSIPCTVPAEQVRPAALLEMYTRLRSCRGLRIIPIDGTAAPARLLFQALRRNEVVGIIGDRDIQGNGLPIRFFGEVTRFPSGPVALALRAGAPLFPGRALRCEDGTFDVEILPFLELPRTGDAKRDIHLGTELLAAAFERFIREAPGQWIVFEPFWRGDVANYDNEEPIEVAADAHRGLRREQRAQ